MNGAPNVGKPQWIYPMMGLLLVAGTLYLASLTRNSLREFGHIGRMDQQVWTISVQGEGKVQATPNIARISLGVQTENSKVEVAQSENTKKMNDLIAELKKMGIAPSDINTEFYSISPMYDWVDGKQSLRAYQVSQNVVVKLRNEKIDQLGLIIETSAKLGANQIGNLSFTIDDQENLNKQARQKAMEQAQEKAKELAAQAGIKLGRLVSFNEWQPYPEQPVYKSMAMEGYGGGSMSAPTIEPGSQDVVVNVSLIYEVE